MQPDAVEPDSEEGSPLSSVIGQRSPVRVEIYYEDVRKCFGIRPVDPCVPRPHVDAFTMVVHVSQEWDESGSSPACSNDMSEQTKRTSETTCAIERTVLQSDHSTYADVVHHSKSFIVHKITVERTLSGERGNENSRTGRTSCTIPLNNVLIIMIKSVLAGITCVLNAHPACMVDVRDGRTQL